MTWRATQDWRREEGGERWVRTIDDRCWISVLHRLTGFGYWEWETAIVFIIDEGSRPKRWESDDRDVLMLRGDWREELSDMPKEQLRQWYADRIDGNRTTMDALLECVQNMAGGPDQ